MGVLRAPRALAAAGPERTAFSCRDRVAREIEKLRSFFAITVAVTGERTAHQYTCAL